MSNTTTNRLIAVKPFFGPLEPRQLLAGQIRGVIWDDVDNDQLQEPGEAGLGDVVVFLDDRKRDGLLGKHERRVRTDAKGNYVFNNVPAGEHVVAVVQPEQATQSWPAPASEFDISLVFDSDLTKRERTVFAEAAAKWEQIIVGDLKNLGGHVDDVEIEIKPSGDLGDDIVATADFSTNVRTTGSQLPFQGLIVINENLLRSASRDFLFGTALHEIAHILGFGGLWDEKALTRTQNNQASYTGSSALNQYKGLFDEDATAVPLETGGGDGTAALHWAQSLGRSGSKIEVMRAFLGTQRAIALSTITVGAMADLGYKVNYRAADPYAGQTDSLFRDRQPRDVIRSGSQTVYRVRVRDGKTKKNVDFGFTSTQPAQPEEPGPPD